MFGRQSYAKNASRSTARFANKQFSKIGEITFFTSGVTRFDHFLQFGQFLPFGHTESGPPRVSYGYPDFNGVTTTTK